MVDQQRITTEEALYRDLLDAYHRIGCTVWELPDGEEIVSLDDLVQRGPVSVVHAHRTYFAINTSHTKSSILDAMGELVFPYRGGNIGLYCFIPMQHGVIVQEIGANALHKIPITVFIDFIKTTPHLNGSVPNGSSN